MNGNAPRKPSRAKVLGSTIAAFSLTVIPAAGDDQKPPAPATDLVDMVLIPAGPFTMGSEAGLWTMRPEHEVYLESFYIDLFEVTNERFARFIEVLGREGHRWCHESEPANLKHFLPMTRYPRNEGPAHPVTGVHWYEAYAFCAWAGKRLPTEAEWEKAARGMDGRTFPWGETWDKSRSCCKKTCVEKEPVGSYPEGASPYGVLDMSGNAAEWVNDFFGTKYYRESARANPTGPASGRDRVLRGGAYSDRPVETWFRIPGRPKLSVRFDHIGFRCASSVQAP